MKIFKLVKFYYKDEARSYNFEVIYFKFVVKSFKVEVKSFKLVQNYFKNEARCNTFEVIYFKVEVKSFKLV